MQRTPTMSDILTDASPVMPVVTVHRLRDAVPIASALAEGGILVVEVTLRTECALEAISRMKSLAGLTVGAGTVIHEQQLTEAVSAGADFTVSPGTTTSLLGAATEANIPFMPGVATPSDILQALSFGYSECKFYPAATAGGTAMLQAFRGPFPGMTFCPTGGLNETDFRAYLALDNVRCVGGGWITPDSVIAAEDWAEITRLARSYRA